MDNPYQPPEAPIDSTGHNGRFAHSIVAFFTGLVIVPAAGLSLVRLRFGEYATGYGSVQLWTNAAIGGLIAAAAVYRHKRMPLWLAAGIGFVVTSLLIIAPSVWALWLR